MEFYDEESSIKPVYDDTGCADEFMQIQSVTLSKETNSILMDFAMQHGQLVLPSDPAINYYDVFEMICHKVAIDYYENIQ